VNTKSTFDAEKALEVLLYIGRRVPDLYSAVKVLYFADKEHLERYGRQISGDTYVAMDWGPVPSETYDLVKCARGDHRRDFGLPVKETLAICDRKVLCPKREPDLDLLSESDMECLDFAIERYGGLNFDELSRLSHEEPAYKEAGKDEYMELESIVRSLHNGQVLLDYWSDD